MIAKLRIIRDSNRSASFNMAADNLLVDKCSDDDNLITLRIYTWEKPSITIGCMQKAEEILDLAAVKRDGVEWVRRPTGGRAVLHQNDLTYSCTFSKKNEAMGKTIAQTYRIITACIIKGFKRCAILCDAHDSYDEFRELKREIKLPCFLSPNRDEVMVGNRKLVGSAQKRTMYGVLQHGSTPIDSSYRRLPEYLLLDEHNRKLQKRLLERKSTCVDEVKPTITAEVLADCLVAGFCEGIDAQIIHTGWSTQELRNIALVAQREAPGVRVC